MLPVWGRRRREKRWSGWIAKAGERGFQIFASENEERKGGTVSLILPSAFSIKQALDRRGIKVDFRKGLGDEQDVIRVGPHFYTKDEEIDILFRKKIGIICD